MFFLKMSYLRRANGFRCSESVLSEAGVAIESLYIDYVKKQVLHNEFINLPDLLIRNESETF